MTSVKTYPYSSATAAEEEEITVSANMIPATDQNSHKQQSSQPHAPPAASVVQREGSYNATVKNNRYIHIQSRKPVVLSYCPNCRKDHVSTGTRTKATSATWLCVVAGVVIFWPLCWVPLVVDPMKQTNHYCQNCGSKVGRVKPFQ